MGKGRYLKSAERACARKSRFETRAAAESFVEGRYRAYRCVVCGAYHLTSGRGDRPEPPTPKPKEPPGPKLGDLDWSAVLRPPQPSTPVIESEEWTEAIPPLVKGNERRSARCAALPGRDGRVLLVVEGKLVKSRPVARVMREKLRSGSEVSVEGTPPTIVSVD